MQEILVTGPRQKTQQQVAELLKEQMYQRRNLIVVDDRAMSLKRYTAKMAEGFGYRVLEAGKENGIRMDILHERNGRKRMRAAKSLPLYMLGDFFAGEPQKEIRTAQYEWLYAITCHAQEKQLTLIELKKYMSERGMQGILTDVIGIASAIKSRPPWRMEDDFEVLREIVRRKLGGQEIMWMSDRKRREDNPFASRTVLYIRPVRQVWLMPFLVIHMANLASTVPTPYTVVLDETSLVRILPGNVSSIIQLGTKDLPIADEIRKTCTKEYSF